LEFPDGQVVLLTFLCEEQQATVLQLPAELQKERDRRPCRSLPMRVAYVQYKCVQSPR
jgi:hypothetical protein